MKHLSRLSLLLVVLAAAPALVAAQSGQGSNNPQPAPTPPVDKPFSTNADEAKSIEEAIKPYVEKAKKSYPEAKKRYLAGLPKGYTFYLTTRLRDKRGRFEQSFVEVKEIRDGVIKGVIASNISLVEGFEQGDSYSFNESEMLDWTIVAPDGTEEGNFVGKFLDEYQKQKQ